MSKEELAARIDQQIEENIALIERLVRLEEKYKKVFDNPNDNKSST